MIYVLALADWERLSLAGAIRRAGLGRKHVQRLRRRLVPQTAGLRADTASDLLARALGRFAGELGLPRERRALLIAHLLGA